MKDHDFDAIVADFYRAATGALDWGRALDKMQAAFSARTVILHTADARTGQVLSLHDGGPPVGDALLEYLREYHRHDARRDHVMSRMPGLIGQWWHCHEHFDEAFVARQRFYQEFLPSYDARYLSAAILQPSDDLIVFLAIELPTSRGVLSADEREVARRLGEHFREALVAHQRVRSLQSAALAGHTLLQTFPYPMWLLSEERDIAYENPAAMCETERDTRVARHGRRLVLTRGRADHELTACIHRLCRLAHGASAVVDLRADAADPPTWLHLSLLVPGGALGAFGDRPQILATLFDPQHISTLDPFALINMFGLTPMEAKVAAGLAEGLTAEQIAATHGTAVSTVRSQAGQVVAKLGVKRGVDVVRLLRQGETLWAGASAARLPVAS